MKRQSSSKLSQPNSKSAIDHKSSRAKNAESLQHTTGADADDNRLSSSTMINKQECISKGDCSVQQKYVKPDDKKKHKKDKKRHSVSQHMDTSIDTSAADARPSSVALTNDTAAKMTFDENQNHQQQQQKQKKRKHSEQSVDESSADSQQSELKKQKQQSSDNQLNSKHANRIFKHSAVKDDNDLNSSDNDANYSDDEQKMQKRKTSDKQYEAAIKGAMKARFGNQLRGNEDEEEDEGEDERHSSKPKSVKSDNNATFRDEFKQLLSYIHLRCPNLEKPLIVELMKHDENCIFVGNVPITQVQGAKRLRQLFAQFGPIESVRIRGLPGKEAFQKKLASFRPQLQNKDLKVFAYIAFKNIESVNKALKYNEQPMGEYRFKITRVNDYHEPIMHKVVLSNLPPYNDFPALRQALVDFLSDCGKIARVKTFREQQHDRHLNVALISFASSDEAQLALRKNGCSIGKHAIKVQPYSENMQFFKQQQQKTIDETTGRPVHKKKQMKKRLAEAKRNAGKQTRKLAFGRKNKNKQRKLNLVA